MIRLNSNIKLTNGVAVNHYVLVMMSVDSNCIELVLDGFSNSDIASIVLEKYALRKEQDRKLIEFQELVEKDLADEETKNYIDNLQNDINEIADKIDSIKLEYQNVIIDTKNIIIPYTDKITEDYIIKEIKNIELFKDVTKYEEKGE